MNPNPWLASISIILVIGFNTLVWGMASVARIPGRIAVRFRPPVASKYQREDVGLIMAAHNEEAVIAASLVAMLKLLPASQVHIVSDGSSDRTLDIAREFGVHVLDLQPNRGKAGAIQAGIDHFELMDRFSIVMLHDADTRLSSDYLETGLPFFDDPDVAAVSGVVKTQTEPPPKTLRGRFLTLHRLRLYAVIQGLVKNGQAAKYINVMPIAPGFASMYRSDVLAKVNITRPGLVVEDINMTFEIHLQKLGRVAFHSKCAVAYTQDPDNWTDYCKQVYRWTLGFWQTCRVHKRHVSKFWASVVMQATELLLSVIVLGTLLPLMALTIYTEYFAETYGYLMVNGTIVLGTLSLWHVMIGFFVPDMTLTVYAAITARRPSLLLLIPFFPFMRFIDSVVVIKSMWAAFHVKGSNGSWVSPVRRETVASNTIGKHCLASVSRPVEIERVS
ncbi:glycosyltransferase [Mycobacterium sp. ITM-2016-00318]|uniref:glycosyltransferase family 2 protein n=1 Tax=Mycobacterium sp. ITM-2016-00318 TaxID=2099693 RepID=UPI000CF8A2DB|nr:glycosyltransferase [Mycobacterium sp. ITM-2016-00318]WNG92963.1 glycosyltransferase [Mycobacterium sp. ITM-2016-00318]